MEGITSFSACSSGDIWIVDGLKKNATVYCSLDFGGLNDIYLIWDKVLKNGPSRIRGRQPLKNFTWSILEHFVLNGTMTMTLTLFETFTLSTNTAQKAKFSIKDFFNKCDQIRRIWSHLLKKSLIENFIFLCSGNKKNESSCQFSDRIPKSKWMRITINVN